MTETTAPVTQEETQKTSSTKGVANLFQTKWINNNLFFFLFLALLAVVYIAYGNWTDKTLRQINKTENQLKELQFEYKSVKSEVMKQGEIKAIEEKAGKQGLKMSTELPKKITIQQNTKQP